jgi:hypothetical protein
MVRLAKMFNRLNVTWTRNSTKAKSYYNKFLRQIHMSGAIISVKKNYLSHFEIILGVNCTRS